MARCTACHGTGRQRLRERFVPCRACGSTGAVEPPPAPRAASLPLAPSDEEPERYHYPRGWGCAGQSSPSSEVAEDDLRGFQRTPKESPVKQHTTDFVSPALAVVETTSDSLHPRTRLDAQVLVADLCRQGFGRVPAPYVARRLGRAESGIYLWQQPAGASRMRVTDLALCPRPFALSVLGGLRAALLPACGSPSRASVAHVLARALAVLCAVRHDDLGAVPTEQLEREVAELDDATGAMLAAVEARRAELLKRRQPAEDKGAR